MIRLIKLTTALFVMTLMPFGVVIAAWRVQPVAALPNGLGRCNDQPCFLGIVPGQTDWAEAKALLTNYNPIASESGDLVVRLATANVSIKPTRDGATVDTVLIHDDAAKFNAIVAMYGSPCIVRTYRGSEFGGTAIAIVVAPSIIANLYLSPGRDPGNPILEQNSSVSDLWLVGNLDVCHTGEVLVRGAVDRRWAGFATWRRYVR